VSVMRKACIAGVVLAAVVLLAAVVASEESKAPEFALPNLEGKSVKLTDLLKQGPVIIDFWATWCKPCIKGFPALDQIQGKYKEQGLTVVAVSVDSPKSQARVAPFIKSGKYSFTVLLDSEGKVAQKYGVVPIPRTFLVDTKGKIVYSSVGYRPTNEEQLEAALKPLLPTKDSGEGKVVQ
jgi:peroxiredoxin